MAMIRFLLRLFVLPTVSFIKTAWQLIGLKRQYPSIRLANGVEIVNSFFGRYNFVGRRTVLRDTTLGDYSYVAEESFILHTKIGKFTCIGPYVKIGLGNHPSKEFISVHPAFYSSQMQIANTFSDSEYFAEFSDTIIGSDVWIGVGAIVRAGVNIGDGAIIGAGSVVTKDIPPFAIVGGIPAKIIRYRHADEIPKLLEWKWWNKDEDWLRKHYKQMHSIQNIDLLMANETDLSLPKT